MNDLILKDIIVGHLQSHIVNLVLWIKEIKLIHIHKRNNQQTYALVNHATTLGTGKLKENGGPPYTRWIT